MVQYINSFIFILIFLFGVSVINYLWLLFQMRTGIQKSRATFFGSIFRTKAEILRRMKFSDGRKTENFTPSEMRSPSQTAFDDWFFENILKPEEEISFGNRLKLLQRYSRFLCFYAIVFLWNFFELKKFFLNLSRDQKYF